MAKKEELKKYAQDLFLGVEQSAIYVGNDKSYWNTIEKRLKDASDKLKFRYVHLTFLTRVSAEEMFLRILREKPKIIYLDFSTDFEVMLLLSGYLHDEVTTSQIPRIGLIDSRKLIGPTRFAGNTFIHIKGGEYHDVAYDPLEITFKDKIKQPEFAKAMFTMESHLIDDMHATYFSATGAHIEGNVKLLIGQAIEIKNSIPKERIPSNSYFIKRTGAHDIATDAKYFYDIDFTFVNEPVFNSEELEKAKEIKSKSQRIQTIKLIKNDRQELLDRYNERIEKSKADQKEWIEENSEGKSLSRTKVLVIDLSMTILQNQEMDKIKDKPMDIRYQSSLSENLKEVFHQRPSIIAFQMLGDSCLRRLVLSRGQSSTNTEDRQLTEIEQGLFDEVSANEHERMKTRLDGLARRIKEIPNYKPFIIIFNCNKFDTRGLQKEFSYPLMMSNSEEININTIIDMASIYNRKAEEKENVDLQRKADILSKTGNMKGITAEDLREKRVYPKSDNDYCVMSYSIPISIKSMTESELTFQTEANLDFLQVFRIEHPLSMSLTVIKSIAGNVGEQVNGFNEYRCLIHTVDEIDKKYIRQYINEIIFSPVRERRHKEQNAFKELNDKFQKLKDEQIKEREAKITD